jgi:hypothetical protein
MSQSVLKSEFKVFEGERLSNFEYPLAIVTFQQDREDLFFTEYFVMRPASNQIISGRDTGSGEHVSAYLELKGVDALIAEAADHAACEVEASIIEKLSKEEKRWWNLSGRFKFRQVEPNTLRSLWMRGRMHEQIKSVALLTRCEILRKELRTVATLPHIQWREEKPAKPPASR